MNHFLSLISLGYAFFCIYIGKYEYTFALGVLWGYTDCCNQPSSPVLASRIYGPDPRIFGVFRFINSVGFMIGMIISLLMQGIDLYY